MAEEEFIIEDAENIRKQGFTYNTFLYQTLFQGTRRISSLFQMQNTPENNAAIFQEAWTIHFAISCKRGSMNYTQEFFPKIYAEVKDFERKANMGTGNLANNSRMEYQMKIQKWLDRLTKELRNNRFTPPASGTLVIGRGVTENPRTLKVRPNSGKNVL
jgi:hypothetical protein